MNIEEFRTYCLSKKGATESFPFDDQALVFKVMNKMFALTRLEYQPSKVNLKCDTEKSAELRVEYDGLIIAGGYNIGPKYWNTVELEKGLPQDLILELIDHSYDLVVQGLTRKLKEELARL